MRSRKLGRLLAAMLATGLIGGTTYAIVTAPAAQAAASDPYTWKNVEIVGGGFVPGIIFNKTTPNLLYARTDIGGAYRWNPSTGRWIPLNDSTSNADYNLLGIESLATDPVDPQRVYVAAGTYVQSWASNGAILRSTSQGTTWDRTDLPFKLGGNEPGRSIGERLQVDPNKNNILYFGTRNDGLWRSTDYGATWARVTSFPVTGNANLGIGVVTFDKASGTAGTATPTIYVSAISSSTPIYRSTDAGATWTALAGQPSAGLPHHVELASDGTLYVTYGDLPGPYEMYGGFVYKRTSAGVWTNITPLVPYQNGESGFGYGGLAVDAQDSQTLMVATISRWGPVDDIFRSVNGGASWTSITSKKVMDTSGAPFLNWHGTPKLGWMIGDVEIDPFNRNRVLFGTGATIFGSDDVTQAEAGNSTHWSVRAQGLEETAVLDIVSPPSGPPLISALGDIGAFRHDSLSVVPPNGMADNPIYGSTNSLDFAELAPSVVLRIGNQAAGADKRAAYSLDGGTTWQPVATEPENPEGSGYGAVSADGTSFVWAPSQRGPSYSTNRGSTWATSAGSVPSGAQVRSDRVNSNKFYALVNGTFYVSTNRGATFAAAAGGLPTGANYFKAVPGIEGDIWAATGYGGLYHSTNSGTSFTKLSNVTEAYTVGFGKAAPGQPYQAIYLNGIVDGVSGLYRSDNAGVTWVRINDDAHQWGWIGRAITGDPRVYGRVYVSTNGRGVIYGDRTGSSDTTVPSTPGTPTASAVTSTSVNLSWPASTDNVGVTGYDVVRVNGTTETVVASPTTNSAAVTGLTGSTAYTFAVYAKDAAGNRSARSGTVAVTTSAPTPDTTVPSTPGTPTASAVTSTSVNLSWPASTDNVGVTGYDVVRVSGTTETVVASPAGNSAAITGLTASTAYTFAVYAKDAAGNRSARSGTVAVTTPSSGVGCTVTYSITGQWGGGFQGDVVIKNTGTVAVNGWTLSYAYANGQTITQLWGGTYTQTGANVSVTNLSWNVGIAAGGGTVNYGFLASWATTNAKPTSFTLNGTACAVG